VPDPLPDLEQKYYCTTIAQVIAIFDQYFFSPTSSYWLEFVSWSTTVHDGYRGWMLEYDDGTRINRFIALCINASGETAYMPYCGIAGNEYRTIGENIINITEHPEFDIEGYSLWMTDVYLARKLELLAFLTDADFDLVHVSTGMEESDNVGTVTAIVVMSDALTAYAITDTYAYSPYDDDHTTGRRTYITGTSNASAPAQVSVTELRAIEALEDIATREVDISFNHQDTVYSTSSRVKTGS